MPLAAKNYFKEDDTYGANWKKYLKLKDSLEKVANKAYDKATYGFRNSYNHRYSPKIELGMTGFVTRVIQDDGDVRYAFGHLDPILLEYVIPLLEQQHISCLDVHERYRNLVTEQSVQINKIACNGNSVLPVL